MKNLKFNDKKKDIKNDKNEREQDVKNKGFANFENQEINYKFAV